MKKFDTYVLMLSQTFPAKHPKAGKPTGFAEKVQEALNYVEYFGTVGMLPTKCAKIHTMRTNCDMWAKRFEKIYAGKACLSLRVWSGKPYHSKQIEIARLTKDDGIGLQFVYVTDINFNDSYIDMNMVVVGEYPRGCCQLMPKFTENQIINGRILAANDGLALQDCLPFFRGHNMMEPLVIIHFTPFRY